MNFRLAGLPKASFDRYFSMSQAELDEHGAVMLRADEPGWPCRVSLHDACVGDRVLLIPYEHHPAASPYRASGPIFVSESAVETVHAPGMIPSDMRGRLYSARAYDVAGMMVDADVAVGSDVERLIHRLLEIPAVDYLHLHHARRGCYACRVERV